MEKTKDAWATIFFICFFLQNIRNEVMCGEFVDATDKDLLEILPDVFNVWSAVSPRRNKMKCDLLNHRLAFDKHTITSVNESQALVALQNSMLAADNMGFYGLNETVTALRTGSVAFILIGKGQYYSVLDYRNAVTGHHLYYFYDSPDPEAPHQLSDGRRIGTYFLNGCEPLLTFIKKSFGRKSPKIIHVHHATAFFKAVQSIGG